MKQQPKGDVQLLQAQILFPIGIEITTALENPSASRVVNVKATSLQVLRNTLGIQQVKVGNHAARIAGNAMALESVVMVSAKELLVLLKILLMLTTSPSLKEDALT